ncbi:MerR family transcriptional regulator [Paraeggerthella sp. Marseille-Q4926]|uniref:MerR family transcriptional regulator n=1 Tax=Paraeggerthella TaxID=651554 RepID=UPI001CE42E05|nr:MerR family transcriptional regulator [Paraeggerthella sp. Marseille-Q4926]
MRSNELAKLAGVTVRTLRHYHAIGLMAEPSRAENGYREYEAEDLVRLLRIKRLSALGFSLSRIGEVLDEMDANLEAASDPNADAALDELDRELELQIAHLQEQRRTIALLKREQLDPDLPIRFARAAKTLMGDAYETASVHSGNRQTLLIAGHLYTDEDVAELERAVAALDQRGLLDRLHKIQDRFENLAPDTPREEIDRLVAETMNCLDPIIDSFDPDNWDRDFDTPADLLIDEMAKQGLNEAQVYAQDRIEEEMERRIMKKRELMLDPDVTS